MIVSKHLEKIIHLRFFVLPIFPKKHKIKTKSGSKRLFINDGKSMKQKALHKFTFVLGGTKQFFERITNNKHITRNKLNSGRKHQQRLGCG